MILEKTVELVLRIYKYHKILPPRVNNVAIGLGYTAVELTAMGYDPFLGLANTLPSIIESEDCTKNDFAGNLTEKPFYELINWSFEPPSIKKIVGIATLNAASQHLLEIINPYTKIKSNLIDHLRITETTDVLFIGNIAPMIKKIRKNTQNIIVVDDNPYYEKTGAKDPIKGSIDDLAERELCADVLICTGTALLNDSLEIILKKFKQKTKLIVLLGPTASFIPDILFDYGVDIARRFKNN